MKNEFVSWVEVGDEEIPIVVQWEGYYQREKISGPPEDCYPAEGEMEITHVEPAGDWPEGLSADEFALAVSKAQDRLTEAAWDEYFSMRDAS